MGMTTNQITLVRAVAENNFAWARTAALACCAEDDTKKNAYVVRKCRELLEHAPSTLDLPANVKGLLTVEDVSKTFLPARYYLSDREAMLIERIVRMHKAALILQEKQIRYSNATLLYGPTGTGKTTFGRYAAYTLGVPFAYVNFSSLIDSLLGNTSKNLAKIFDFLSTQTCLIMLDEIDCIGLKRGGSQGPEGELARTTISLMQELDKLNNEHIILAATNRYDRLDPALLRRFSVHHEVTPLLLEERVCMIREFLDDVNIEYDTDNVWAYAAKDQCQANIMNAVVQAVADAVINESAFRLPEA